MTAEDRERLVAAATTAYRARDVDGRVRAHHAWHDLDEEGRRAVFEETLALRAEEAALDPGGRSGTARAVLARIANARRGG